MSFTNIPLAVLTGDPADDTKVISAGTGQKVLQTAGPAGPAGITATIRGVWASGTTYVAGPPPDAVFGSNGHTYVSLVSGNVGHDPTTDGGVHWMDTLPPSVVSASRAGSGGGAGPTDPALVPHPDGAGGWTWGPSGDPLVGLTPANLLQARAALARCRLDSFARINCVGDSLTVGAGATAWPANAWVTHLAALLANDTVPSGGTGLALLGTNSDGPTPFYPDSRITLVTGTWTYGQNGFGDSVCLVGSQANADQMTFEDPSQQVDTFVLYMLSGGGAAPFTVVVDAGAPVAIDPNSSGNPSVNSITWASIPAGAAGIHTLTVNAPTTIGKNVYLCGVEGTKGSVGARVSRLGVAGTTTANYLAGIAPVTSFLPADLTLVMFGINEYLAQGAPATFLANLNTLITDLLAGGDVILMVPPPPGDAETIPWASYVAEIHAAATANGLPIIDFTQRWISFTAANALGMYADNHHPSNRGNWDMGTAIHAALRQASLV